MIHRTILAFLFSVAVGFNAFAQGQPSRGMLIDASSRGTGGGPPPGMINCDYGQPTTLPTGTVGADLATAGFTHCALNADFTDNSGAPVNGGSGLPNWVMNNPSTYVNECAGTRNWGRLWMRQRNGGDANQDPAPMPCNRISIANDGTGTNVLTFNVTNSDIPVGSTNSPSTQDGWAIYWPLCGQSCTDLEGQHALPVAHYMEITYRLPPPALTQNNNPVIWTLEEGVFDGFTSSQSGGFLDLLPIEFNPQGSSATSMDHYSNGDPNCTGAGDSKCTAGGNWTPDAGNYHTQAYIFTTDAGTHLYGTFYEDGTLPTFTANCCAPGLNTATEPAFDASLLIQHDQRLMIQLGVMTAGTFQALANPLVVQIKSIRVFTCATYKGQGNDCTTTEAGGGLVFH